VDNIADNSKILITGASGFIATYIIEVLVCIAKKYNSNITIYALARDPGNFWLKYKHHRDNEKLVFINQDVNQLSAELDKIAFTDIIHAASKASPIYYGKDPVGTLSANTIGTNNLLALAHKVKANKFTFISSSEVYGNSDEYLISENSYGYIDPTNIRSCYAESKRMGENMCVSWMHQFNVPIVIIRPFHTYGPGMNLNDGRVYADFVKCIVDKENISLNSDGSAERAFCYLADAVKGILTAHYQGKPGEAYNLGNPEETYSIKQLATLLQRLYPQRCKEVRFNSLENTEGYIASTVNRVTPCIKKISNIGWIPTTSVTEGFERTIESYINETN
jgi:nucleoside-diphosphate-sugar epimerase